MSDPISESQRRAHEFNTEAVNQHISDLIHKQCIAAKVGTEQLTEQQLADAIRQAIACGDFTRHVCVSNLSQAVVYIPFSREQRLNREIDELKKQAEAFAFVRERLKQLEIAFAQAKEEWQRIWEQVSAENAALKEANSTANKLIESQANENDKLVADLNSQLESAVKGSFDASQVMAKENAALREAITVKNRALEVACVASCNCTTKSPDPLYHAESCPYKLYRGARCLKP